MISQTSFQSCGRWRTQRRRWSTSCQCLQLTIRTNSRKCLWQQLQHEYRWIFIRKRKMKTNILYLINLIASVLYCCYTWHTIWMQLLFQSNHVLFLWACACVWNTIHIRSTIQLYMLSSSTSPNTPLIYMHPSPLRFLHTHSSSVLFLVYNQHLNTGDAARECLWIDTFLETKKNHKIMYAFFFSGTMETTTCTSILFVVPCWDWNVTRVVEWSNGESTGQWNAIIVVLLGRSAARVKK